MINNYSVLLILLGLGLVRIHAIDHDKYEALQIRTVREASENQKGVRTTVIRRRLHADQNATAHDISTNQRARQAVGNTQPEKSKTDYVNKESEQYVTTLRPDIRSSRRRSRPVKQTDTQSQSGESTSQKQIVKKNVESDFGFQPQFAEGTDYITNFNLNPINIDQLNIPRGEKQILQGLSVNSNPFIHNPIPTVYPALQNLQQNVPNQLFGYKIIPNVQIQPSGSQGHQQIVSNNDQRLENTLKITPNVQIQPTGIQGHQQIVSNNDQRLENALKYIHNEPQVKLTLQNLPTGIPYEHVQEQPRIVNQIHKIPVYTSTEDYTKEYQGYGDYQQQHPEVSYRKANLSSQNNYPVILLDPDAKLGLPFYPSSKEIHKIPDQEFNYEGIPVLGRRYNNENQTEEEKEQQRRYLLGLTFGLGIPPPVGYTRETIWQAGDPVGNPQPEELTLQLNETCAYITWNETIPGNEDHRPNIWQAGDYSAQLQEEEVIRSANITCETYNQNILENVTGPYTLFDYCWQCVKNDGNYAYKNFQDKLVIPQFIPDTYGPNNKQMQQNQQQENNQQYDIQQQNPQNDNYQEVAENYGLGHIENSPNFQHNQDPMRITVYPNLGYRNDPETQHLGLQRRSTKRGNNKKE